ncbi:MULTISPECIES: DUF1513 domain-containing protein [unclassified Vibrio]|uniref:DUF1513 domain-containing protein n=1 Tax=Vibrio sp. HB236076 TaxID=3232307 RepID=A0AB39HJD7_9VIBR|nr:DUF1513 domain-containing protein [Vibrio sp. HB161653]MDP5253516.1 DUF1513 domain-containing protein [Vibrio sp. HB161653]
MQPMAIDQQRRQLLKQALALTALPFIPACTSVAERQPGLIGCALNGRRGYQAIVADRQGIPIHRLELPARGHGVASAGNGHATVFARRPGDYMMVLDYRTGQMIKMIAASGKRYFYGHGVYSFDQQWLYVTEGEKRTSQGIIGVYSVEQGYRKVAEFSGFGIGPHEIIQLDDGRLVVGVGGVHTQGRTPLNLDSMSPSLCYLSGEGALLDQQHLADAKLSIRHLAQDGQGAVLCGQQYRGTPDDYPALIAIHKAGQPLRTLKARADQWARFNHYIASIAADEHRIIATSPPGNCYGVWDKHTLELLSLHSLADASGVVATKEGFYLSSGSGDVIHQRAATLSRYHSNVLWDNHWQRIRLS